MQVALLVSQKRCTYVVIFFDELVRAGFERIFRWSSAKTKNRSKFVEFRKSRALCNFKFENPVTLENPSRFSMLFHWEIIFHVWQCDCDRLTADVQVEACRPSAAVSAVLLVVASSIHHVTCS
jgi:hypothetical protein